MFESRDELIHAGVYFAEKENAINDLYHYGRKGMKWGENIFFQEPEKQKARSKMDKDKFDKMYRGNTEESSNPLKRFLSGTGNKIKDTASDVYDTASNKVNAVGNAGKSVNKAYNLATSKFGEKAVNNAIARYGAKQAENAVKDTGNKIKDTATNVYNNAANKVNAVGNMASNKANAIGNAGKMVDNTYNYATSKFGEKAVNNAISRYGTNQVGKAISNASNADDRAKKDKRKAVFETKLEDLKSGAENVGDKIKEGFGNVGNTVKSWFTKDESEKSNNKSNSAMNGNKQKYDGAGSLQSVNKTRETNKKYIDNINTNGKDIAKEFIKSDPQFEYLTESMKQNKLSRASHFGDAPLKEFMTKNKQKDSREDEANDRLAEAMKKKVKQKMWDDIDAHSDGLTAAQISLAKVNADNAVEEAFNEATFDQVKSIYYTNPDDPNNGKDLNPAKSTLVIDDDYRLAADRDSEYAKALNGAINQNYVYPTLFMNGGPEDVTGGMTGRTIPATGETVVEPKGLYDIDLYNPSRYKVTKIGGKR